MRHQSNPSLNPWLRFVPWFVAVLGLAMLVSPAWRASGQIMFDAKGGFGPGPAIAAPATPGDVTAADEFDPDGHFQNSAILKTDPDIDRLVRRAHELTDEQRWDVAATLWQQVLDRSGSELTTRAEWVNKRDEFDESDWLQTYKSVRTEVERLLATMPPEGLREYRLVADAPARTLFAAAEGDREEPSLEEVVRRYFVSSVGDDAAWRLGCLLLDRHDFTGAGRLFEKILLVHPDPTMPREEVMLRLAVCQARSGNRTLAAATYENLGTVLAARPSAVSSEAFQLVGQDVEKNHTLVADTYRASGSWPMTLGGPARDGHMAALDAAALAGDLHESWSHRTEVFDSDAFRSATSTNASAGATVNGGRIRVLAGGMIVDPYGNAVQAAPSPSREVLVQNWKDHLWTPAAKALLVDGKIVFRTPTRLACYDATAVGEARLLWMAPPDGSLSPDGKSFDPENVDRLKTEAAEYMRLSAMSGANRGDQPNDYRGAWLFGDRTCQLMTYANNTVYFVDDVPQLGAGVDPNMVARFGGAVQTPDGNNGRSKLMAIDATTGKILWEWPGEDGGEKDATDFRFIGQPVPHRRTLLVPVYATGGLWVYAFETEDGKNAAGKRTQSRKLAWKASLCDDAKHGGDRWAPVTMCLDGGDLFVATGRGVVFALDAASGAIRWGVRYERTMSAPAGRNQFNGMQMAATFRGWDENYVVARGPWVILMASDYHKLVALNRATGDFVWPGVGIEDVNYVLGVVGDNLYVAGPKVVRAYSLRKEGAIAWSVDLEEPSHGRGALTADSIYVPVKDKIHRYDLKGKLVSKANVRFSRDRDDPVGNLYTDGKTLFALGPERVYALTNAEQQLKRLDAQISAGDESLRRRRMMLRARAGLVDGAIEDLRVVQTLIAKEDNPPAAVLNFTLSALVEMELAENSPLVALDLLVGDRGALATLSAAQRKALALSEKTAVSAALGRALERVAAKPSADAAPLVLKAIAHWPDAALRMATNTALKACAGPESVGVLREGLSSPSRNVRAAAATSLGHVLKEQAADELAKHLSDAADEVRLAAASALVEFGDRRALAPLVALLDSESVTVRHDASRMLLASTGEEIGFIAYVDAKDRQPHVDKWKAWLAAHGATAKLRVPLDFHTRQLGRVLVSDFDAGVVRELDREGNVVWTSPRVPGAWGIQGLPNGHRLVTSFQARYAVEFDREGNEVWRSEGRLPFYPTSIERLPNGNTLVGGRDLEDRYGVAVELGRDGTLLEDTLARLAFKPYDLRMQATGRLLATCTYDNLVCEFERDGTRVAHSTIDGLDRPESARRELNGHLLVVDNGGLDRQVADRLRGVRRIVHPGRVLEYDEDLKLVHTTTNESSEICDAVRLGNGNLLILDKQAIKEVDREGKELWSKELTGGKRLSAF